MVKLLVYIAANCWTCEETARIVDDVGERFPDVDLEVVELATVEPKPENVFAAPTYLLNGRVVSLGNPTRAQLYRWLAQAREEKA